MAKKDYSEDLLIQAPTAELLEKQLGWESVFAQDEGAKGGWGPDSLLGRASDSEVVLTRDVLAALKRLNPGLPDAAYQDALALVVQDDITKSLIAQNEEKYKLLRDGVPVKYRDAAGRLVDKRLRLIDFDEPKNNRYLAVRELWVRGKLWLRRPDVIGFVNGYVTLQFSIPSFITTLGMLFIARSLTIVISGGFPPLLPSDLPTWLFTDYIWQGALFRMSFVWFVGIAVLAAALLSLTNFGNWIRATGGFNEAAASMGIPVKRVKIVCFMLCSVLAGFAGLLQVLRLGSPLPSIGEGLELQAVAAAVIGGTALAGGIGTVFGAIIGTLLIRTIDNGLVLSRVDANWFKFAIGVLTMFAVIANAWMGKLSRKIKVEAHK